jgi:hypothetical protein
MSITAPWNASWTAEDKYEVRNCRWAGHKPAIWSPHRPGEGKPIFANPHMVRQRRSVAEYRCTVCGEKTDPWDRWWFRLGQTHVPGWAFVTTEAPVHGSCAKIAMQVCPHLRELDGGPVPWDHPDGVLSAVVGGPATENDFGLTLNGRTVIGHLKFAWKRLPYSMREPLWKEPAQ